MRQSLSATARPAARARLCRKQCACVCRQIRLRLKGLGGRPNCAPLDQGSTVVARFDENVSIVALIGADAVMIGPDYRPSCPSRQTDSLQRWVPLFQRDRLAHAWRRIRRLRWSNNDDLGVCSLTVSGYGIDHDRVGAFAFLCLLSRASVGGWVYTRLRQRDIA
jgi:hypothetical protein